MSRSKVDRICEKEKKAEQTRKSAGKANKGKQAKKSPDATPETPVDVNPEDYKGARKELRHAVKAVVKANSTKIAKKLLEKAEGGDMRGTEMMLSLIEKKKADKDGKKKKRNGPSWAELLASEPEWTGEEDEAAMPEKAGHCEIGAGSQVTN